MLGLYTVGVDSLVNELPVSMIRFSFGTCQLDLLYYNEREPVEK